MTKIKVKVGDKIQLKSELKSSVIVEVVNGMLQFAGKLVKVTRIDIDGSFKIEGCRWWFDNNMIDNTKKVKRQETKPRVFKAKYNQGAVEKQTLSATTQPTQFAMIKTAEGITTIIDSVPYSIVNSHTNYDKIVQCIKHQEYSAIPELINISKSIEVFGGGRLEVKNGVVKFDSKELHGCIVDSILSLMKDGFDIKPIEAFLENLHQNPSFRAIKELYGFLEYGKLPITEDGYFLTYKKVRKDFKDIHSGKFDNSVGKVCEMPRSEVDDVSTNTCSSGLHVCSYEYTKSFGGSDSRLILCKVNPRDVVSIPVDYNNTKMRCCRYEVVADITGQGDILKGQSLYTEGK